MSYALHIVPVGLSLREGIRENLSGAPRGSLLSFLDPTGWQSLTCHPSHPFRDEICHASDETTTILDTSVVFRDARAAAASAIKEAHTKRSSCSEWQSLYSEVTMHPTDQHDGDAYLFLATDTDAGLLTATAVAVGTADERPVHYIHDPNEKSFRRTRVEAGGIFICRIPYLDLSAPNTLTNDTWSALGSVGHVACETAREQIGQKSWRIIVHLSGGYKAQLPSLLVMAEAIKSVLISHNGHGARITAWTLHRDSIDAPYDNRVEIAIRHLPSRAYKELYGVRDKVLARQSPIGADNLIGSCLDANHDPTPFGRIMLNVIPNEEPRNA